MKRLLEPDGLRALDQALGQSPLLAFDFDGTLAPLVDHPEDARVPPALEPRLARLAELADIAIISGRALADLERRLSFRPRFLVGNHGAEGGAVELSQAAVLAGETDMLLGAMRSRLSARRAVLTAAGVEVEDKGRSLALHYRRAPDPIPARAAIEQALAGHDPRLEVYGGKDVVNIVVAAAPDKGRALLALVERGSYGTAVFVGDDVNDESVFSRAPSGWITIRVGTDADSEARWRLASIHEMPAFIERMIETLEFLARRPDRD